MLSLPGGASTLRLWSAEEPHLYLLLISLVPAAGAQEGGGGVLEIEACQVWEGILTCACCDGQTGIRCPALTKMSCKCRWDSARQSSKDGSCCTTTKR